LLLLCAQGALAGKIDLHWLTLELAGASLQVTEDTVAATGIGPTQRLHIFDLNGDGQLEVLAVDGGSVGSSDGQLSVDWGSVDPARQIVMKHDSRPIGQGPAVLLHANVTGDKAEEVILALVSYGSRYLAILTPASTATWSVPAGIRLADYANVGPSGIPMMPTLGAGDVNGDGLAELFVPDPWGATQLLYHVERWDSLVSSAPWRELGKAATRNDGTTLPHEPHVWTPLLDGMPAGQLVDLDSDGEKDLLDFFGDGQTDMVISELSRGAGKGGLQRVSWTHDNCGGNGTSYHRRPLLRDWNADGMADLLLPVVCPDGLHLESLVSKGGHYEHAGSHILTAAKNAEVITWLPAPQSGESQLVVADRQPSCGTYCYTIRRFEGNPAAGFRELSPLVEKLSLLYQILLMIDLNDDGALDLLGPGESVCFGGDYRACENVSFGEGDGSSWYSNNGIFRDEAEDELALITFKPTEVIWTSYSHGVTRLETTSLDIPEGRLLNPRARAACDIDGDGRKEILIISGQQGRQGAVVSGLFKDPSSGKLTLQGLGSIAGFQGTTDIDCTRSRASPSAPAVLPDLVLYQEWQSTYYRIRNESR
jgi:hypothetical protein